MTEKTVDRNVFNKTLSIGTTTVKFSTPSLNPIPTSLLLECLDAVLPTMTSIINDSLKSGVFPSFYKSAIVTPLLKKSTLDPS